MKKEQFLLPFLWLKGEDNETIKTEIEKIYSCGIREICLESRPHPDFLGPAWWDSLDVIVAEAKKRDMRIWILDDDKFPTGHANGAFLGEHKVLAKRYLAERHVDIMGPCTDSAILVKNFLSGGDELIAILACPKPDTESLAVSENGIIDLSASYHDGFVFFDLPDGAYRLFVIFTTSKGGGREGYMNLIDTKSVRVLIDEVYEKHYAHYAKEFGTTIAGFFSDEPELGNVPGYSFHAKLGSGHEHLPWSDELRELLLERWGADYYYRLPALWYDMGDAPDITRSDFMDCVTKLVYRCFSGQIGAWCSAHGVEYIGHIIEDDNAHARLGCSIGHYFREMKGQHMAGIDVVHHQIVPGFTGKIHQWIAGDADGEFFHFGLAKLAASASLIDENKKGRALCEIFGNYGWAEGVSLMRWLIDHMLVRGINHFTPHAFSMMDHDKDCPPHFYARGENPQFEAFAALMMYTNRMADMLYGGTHMVDGAILYHAEAEWSAPEAMLFQKPMRACMEQLIDCDVIPADALKAVKFSDGSMRIRDEVYSFFVIPYAKYLHHSVVDFSVRAKREGVRVFVVDALPTGDEAHNPLPEAFLEAVTVIELHKLAAAVREDTTVKTDSKARADITARIDSAAKMSRNTVLSARQYHKDLRAFTVKKDGQLILMLFNESVSEKIDSEITVNVAGYSYCYALNVWHRGGSIYAWNDNAINVHLEAGESAVFVLSKEAKGECFGIPIKQMQTRQNRTKQNRTKQNRTGQNRTRQWENKTSLSHSEQRKPEVLSKMTDCLEAAERKLLLEWKVFAKKPLEEAVYLETLQAGEKLPNMNGPGRNVNFSGTYIYQGRFAFQKKADTDYYLRIPMAGDTAEVILNDHSLGQMVRFPDKVEITDALLDGDNRIEIRIATTLVWERMDGASTHLQVDATGLLAAPQIEAIEYRMGV